MRRRGLFIILMMTVSLLPSLHLFAGQERISMLQEIKSQRTMEVYEAKESALKEELRNEITHMIEDRDPIPDEKDEIKKQTDLKDSKVEDAKEAKPESKTEEKTTEKTDSKSETKTGGKTDSKSETKTSGKTDYKEEKKEGEKTEDKPSTPDKSSSKSKEKIKKKKSKAENKKKSAKKSKEEKKTDQKSRMDSDQKTEDSKSMTSTQKEILEEGKELHVEYENFEEGCAFTKEVNPSITICDPRLCLSACRAELYYADGRRASSLEKLMLRKEDEGENKITFFWKDFPREKEYDSRYLLKIAACDQEGNLLGEEESFSFSVDRYGARYELTEETAKYVKDYYHKEEADISLLAYSLYPLESRIYLNRNGEERELSAEEYELETEETGEDALCGEGWYLNRYRIFKDCFSEEGEYQLYVKSRELVSKAPDQEEEYLTESENKLWTQDIHFAIDRTGPGVIIHGLKEEVYALKEKEYHITASDETRLKKVKIYVRKEGDPASQTEKIYEEKDFAGKKQVKGCLKESASYQILGYEAWDYAGNKTSSVDTDGEKRVLVHKENFVRWYYEHSLRIAMVSLLVFGLIFAGILLTGKGFFGILKDK